MTWLSGRLALGCMRLSSVEVKERDAIQLLHRALDIGVRVLDTAGVYAPDDSSLGHNERLVANALSSWQGNSRDVVVATKVGLTRPGGRWRPDGRAGSLRDSCELSLERLGGHGIDLLQLHAVDPKVPIERSVRALARLRDEGRVRRIGLSNVRVEEIERAGAVAAIDAVQVALSPLDTKSIKSGVVRHCAELGIPLLLHSPLGGAKGRRRLARDPVLRTIADEHSATPQQIALAWLLGLCRDLEVDALPLFGATRPESVESSLESLTLVLDLDQIGRLDVQFPAGQALRRSRSERPPGARAQSGSGDEVVLIMGYPAAGKSTLASDYEQRGFARLNRDQRGGRLGDLLPELDRLLEAGQKRVVLDNTYATRASRFDVVEAAWHHRVPVRCLWLDTTLEQAQVNAALRMVRRHGRLLEPEEMKQRSKSEPNDFAPRAQYRYRRELEEPRIEEGFSSLERISFERKWRPGTGKALLFDLEDLVGSGSTDRERAPTLELLRDYVRRDYRLIGLAFLPSLGNGRLDPLRFESFVDRLAEQTGLDFDALSCPHPPGPPVCWCRKPHPGLGVVAVERFGLDPQRCVVLGEGPADQGFAERMGFSFVNVVGC